MVIAWVVFRENVDRRIAARGGRDPGRRGRCSRGRAARRLRAGGPAIVGACVAWGIDNNLTRKLSPRPIRCRSP